MKGVIIAAISVLAIIRPFADAYSVEDQRKRIITLCSLNKEIVKKILIFTHQKEALVKKTLIEFQESCNKEDSNYEAVSKIFETGRSIIRQIAGPEAQELLSQIDRLNDSRKLSWKSTRDTLAYITEAYKEIMEVNTILESKIYHYHAIEELTRRGAFQEEYSHWERKLNGERVELEQSLKLYEKTKG